MVYYICIMIAKKHLASVLFINSWSRWSDIQRHGHFKHKLQIEDIRTIARAMVSLIVSVCLYVCVCVSASISLELHI